jgi:hypothetical protein
VSTAGHVDPLRDRAISTPSFFPNLSCRRDERRPESAKGAPDREQTPGRRCSRVKETPKRKRRCALSLSAEEEQVAGWPAHLGPMPENNVGEPVAPDFQPIPQNRGVSLNARQDGDHRASPTTPRYSQEYGISELSRTK